MKSALDGFFMADTCYYYPEDRSMSESIKVGYELADVAIQNAKEASMPTQSVVNA